MNNKIALAVCMGSTMLFAASDQKITVPLNENGERHIVVIVASYNNANFYRHNLDSLFFQRYDNYHIIYIDDCSTDGTYEMVNKYTRQRKMDEKVLLIHNEKRLGALHNQYDAIHMCKDTDLIIIVDGDDWLFDPHVFSFLNATYSNSDIWLTYGQFIQHPTRHRGWCVQMPEDVVKSNGFRNYVHAPGHLRTFYAGLFKQIKKEDLMYGDDFFRMTGDIAAMFPMIEMARDGHFKFLQKILMVYNIGNPLNDHKVVQGLQRKLDLEIRRRPKYDQIETPFLSTEGSIETAEA